MPPTFPEVLISEDRIRVRIAELAGQISRDYGDRGGGGGEIVMVGVLKGAFIFLADLARAMTIPRRVDFMGLSSYGRGGAQQSGVRLVMDLRESIEGQHVLVVEDIVDTGHTLHYLLDTLFARHPASLKACALVQKRSRTVADVSIDYLGFEIPDRWVVGFGLDYKDRFRTLPYIGTITPEE